MAAAESPFSPEAMIAFVATMKPDAAKLFYGETLGFALREDTPFALVFDAGGVMLRVQKARELTPAQHTVLGWRVADIAAEMQRLGAKGVLFTRFPGLPQDEHGVWTTPDGHKVAWFSDPDGNALSLTQFAA